VNFRPGSVAGFALESPGATLTFFGQTVPLHGKNKGSKSRVAYSRTTSRETTYPGPYGIGRANSNGELLFMIEQSLNATVSASAT
jgi:hypothetical protein